MPAGVLGSTNGGPEAAGYARVRCANDRGYQLGEVQGAEAADDADGVVVPSWFDDGHAASESLRRVLQQAHQRGVTILGLCLGSIPVADAGLLSGRRAVTHWRAFDSLAVRHPDVFLDKTVLYIDHGDVMTSAGTASGLDACLHLVRARLGADAANQVARRCPATAGNHRPVR